MLNTVCHTFYHLAPWLIPTLLFTLFCAHLFERTSFSDTLINLLNRLSGRK
jgi:hypothetical protein